MRHPEPEILTEEEVEQIIREQMQKLPRWWQKSVKNQKREEYGRKTAGIRFVRRDRRRGGKILEGDAI